MVGKMEWGTLAHLTDGVNKMANGEKMQIDDKMIGALKRMSEELEPEEPIDYSKLIERETWNGDASKGEKYYSDPSKVIEIYHDGELVDYKTLSYSDQNFVDSLLDSFEEGYNQLEESNGELIEVMTQGVWKLMREAVRA
jgi:hypothetical protein